ncbi:MAG: ferric reductase-like transmembrane domain-containing protein [Proteobacteria bacterium]|uniref:Ferric reductase-like transmembrane domain-containing protein n=1 Tax=Candidatus Avisuccinivibrio stercorigallinarum TaxID=2840704 RepID=A0A9D9DBE6_9GAMM|nr:ferric reductase-like transmembrane domain-containing protein [Candidatus Avisuccinivibrio stercorigallinarum]
MTVMMERAALRRSFNPWALSGLMCLGVVILYLISLLFYEVPDNRKGIIRELQYLSGGLSWFCACIIMLTASRPRLLEKFIALDQSYKLHKSLGILCALFGLLHFFAKDLCIALMDLFSIEFPASASAPRGAGGAGGYSLRQFAEDSAYLTYFGLFLVIITFVSKIPYRIWQQTHRLLALVFIVMCVHCWVLTESYQLRSPLAWFLTALTLAALPGAVKSLFAREGSASTQQGTLRFIKEEAPYLRVGLGLPNTAAQTAFAPGKFILLKLKDSNKHPFTIARVLNLSGAELTLELFITDKGFFAAQLQKEQPGAAVWCEGPYGENCLNLPDPEGKAAWVLQGSGMTQGLAFCELLRQGQISQQITPADAEDQDGAPGDGRLDILLLARRADDALLMQLISELYALAPQAELNADACEVLVLSQGSEGAGSLRAAAPAGQQRQLPSSLKVKLSVHLSSKHGRVSTEQLTALISESTYCSACGSTPLKAQVCELFKAQGGRSCNFSAEHSSWR